VGDRNRDRVLLQTVLEAQRGALSAEAAGLSTAR
jgi:hypothetical protein